MRLLRELGVFLCRVSDKSRSPGGNVWPGKPQVGVRRRAEALQHLLELEQSRQDLPPEPPRAAQGGFRASGHQPSC